LDDIPIAARERRSRAASIGHKEPGRAKSFHNTADLEGEKSLDLEEATMMRSSTGDLRTTLAPSSIVRSLSDGKLNEVLDGFMKLDRELREVKAATDEDGKSVIEGLGDPLFTTWW